MTWVVQFVALLIELILQFQTTRFFNTQETTPASLLEVTLCSGHPARDRCLMCG